jgi:hypothetical protein
LGSRAMTLAIVTGLTGMCAFNGLTKMY